MSDVNHENAEVPDHDAELREAVSRLLNILTQRVLQALEVAWIETLGDVESRKPVFRPPTNGNDNEENP